MMTFRTHIGRVCWGILFFMKMSYGFSDLLLRIGVLLGVFGVTVTPNFSTFTSIFTTNTEKLQHLIQNCNIYFKISTNTITVTSKLEQHTVTPKSVYSYPLNCIQLLSNTLQNEVILC